MDVMKLANSLPMWIACGIPVVFVMIQALLFAREAYRSGEKVGLTKTQMNKAIKSSAVTSIGPSIVVLSGMLSLLVTVGGPVGWMRLSMIGSVMFESIAAGLGTSAVGVTLGTDPMTSGNFDNDCINSDHWCVCCNGCKPSFKTYLFSDAESGCSSYGRCK